MRFRLAPTSVTLDALERPKRPPIAKLKSSYGAHQKNFNEDRPISLVGKCRPIRILARNIKCMRICAGVPSERGVKIYLPPIPASIYYVTVLVRLFTV